MMAQNSARKRSRRVASRAEEARDKGERRAMRPAFLFALLTLLFAASAMPAAAELLKVGKSPGSLLAYVPLDVGIEKGFFAKRGLEIEVVSFDGASKQDMALASESIDVACGSPMSMSLMV